MSINKEANRLYWAVKGMLIPESWSDKDISETYNAYTKRLWGNHESMTGDKMEGFEEAYNERLKRKNFK